VDSYLDFYISVPVKVSRSAPLTGETLTGRQRLGPMEWVH